MAQHRWIPTTPFGFICTVCNLERRKPKSSISIGLTCVDDWDYFIDGEWVRMSWSIPACKRGKIKMTLTAQPKEDRSSQSIATAGVRQDNWLGDMER